MFDNRPVIGVIAEFNPFHDGHRYLFQNIKESFPDSIIVVVMSGDFVQRGEPAIFHKFQRAEEAVSDGADLCVQLPTVFSTAAAADFAAGGIAALRSIGCVDYIAFGVESENKELLEKIAALESSEKEEVYEALIRSGLEKGLSYPRARSLALTQFLETDEILWPNDILGVEYLKALHMQETDIKPVMIHRDQSYQSAHAIRDEIRKNSTSDTEGPVFLDDFSTMLTYRILSLVCEKENLSAFSGVSLELAQTIRKELFTAACFSERIMSLKTRNFTYSRISRALLHILLDIKEDTTEYFRHSCFGMEKSDSCNTTMPLPYLQVLALRKDMKPCLGGFLSEPVTTVENYRRKIECKASQGRKEDIYAMTLLENDIFAAALYNAVAGTEQKFPHLSSRLHVL